ncbi:MAG TPA: winged helix-turn-helix transcriptional regulator [Solirubrobacteraceae bacterium]|jgi:DNA-binding HxlR family transcriptional regulator|nr:winged helix-turn-helix transcriptional regulator [Solirubrobacteraceae bacterium]
MSTRRSYRDACPIARALDVVGERWALLVVRELLLGGQRFSDLRRALPGASTNMLTDRLRELEAHGVIHRHMLPPPAASWVYELTQRGRGLEPALQSLGAWGSAESPASTAALSATSVLLFLRGSARAHPNPPTATYRVQLHDRVWTISTVDGQLEVLPTDPSAPDAAIRTDPSTLNALLSDPATFEDAIATGTVDAAGDLSALRRLLHVAA